MLVDTLTLLELGMANPLSKAIVKAGTAKDSSLGQILGYINYVSSKISKKGSARGIIIADDFDVRVRYAIKSLPNVTLKKYRVNFNFEDVVT